jgi:hypothetical protein
MAACRERMRALVLVLLIGCGGSKKYATFSPPPTSALARETKLAEPASNAQVSGDVAVRHRRLSWKDSIAVVSGSAIGTGSAPPPPPAQPLDSPEPKQPEKLVVEAWLDVETDNVAATVNAIRARVEQGGGRVVSENVQGSGKSASSAAMELRVPPAQATSIAAWIETLGKITSKRMLASDVSKKLFDYELALENLKLTMERLQKLATQSGPVADLLTIEKEMTRVRGEIEAIKGEQRWLVDRVELATITLSLTRSGEQPDDEYAPEARIYPGPQLAMLTLFDPGMRERTRLGGGATVRAGRYATFELDVFPRGDGGDSRAVIATFGSALYSSYLRNGHRRYFNPYVGGRVGYGYLSGNGSPLIAGELGVELFKHKYLLVDTSLRVVAFVRTEAEAALHATLGVSVPF